MGKKETSPRAQVPQSCIFCGKQLSSYPGLIEHINGHTGERSCHCVPCDLWFASATVLCHHRRIVHEGKKFTCPFCNKQFNFSSNLSDHKRRAHFKQYQHIKRRCEIQRRGGGSRSLIRKKTPNPLRVVKNKTEKRLTFPEKVSKDGEVLEESQEEEEEISEESEDEPLYPHQRSNHEEYFGAIDKQRSAALVAIFKAFPLVRLNEDKFQVPSFGPSVESVKKITEVTTTIAKNVVEVNNNKVLVQKGASKILPTSTSKECTICGKSSTTRSNLFKHLRNVHGVQKPARKCSMKRKRKEEEGVTENKSFPPNSSGNQVKYKCYKCSSLFPSVNLLRKHMTTRHPGCSGKITTGQRRIPVRSRRTGQEESFNERRRGSERGLFKCAKCDGKYSWRFDLIKHIRQKHPEVDVASLEIVNMATPNVSSKPFGNKAKQEVVNKKQTNITPGVIRRNYKSIKVAAKTNKIVLKCYKCSATFPRVAALKRHMTLMHQNCPTKILIVNQDLSSTSTSAKNTSTMTGAFKCPECSVIFKWKKNLVRHIRRTHDSPGNCGTGGVLKDPPPEELNPTENLDQANTDLGSTINSALSFKPIVSKRRILRRARKVTVSEVKPIMTPDPGCMIKEEFKDVVFESNGPAVSLVQTDVKNMPDSLPKKKSQSAPNSGRARVRGQCQKCGRWFMDKQSLDRHTKRKSCHYVKREALIKLDATLDFICPICNRNFTDNGKRHMLECHLASVHRFHHENAREYQHLKTEEKVQGIYFCPLCGSKEASRNCMRAHLRRNHMKELGAPKKTPKITGSAVPISTINGINGVSHSSDKNEKKTGVAVCNYQEPLKFSENEVHPISLMNTISDVNNLPDSLASVPM